MDSIAQVPEIQVTDYSNHESKFSKHTLYTIRGSDQNGNFEVQRRFKDFLSLRTFLTLNWPGCYVPSLPGKKLFYGNDPKTIIDRQQFLNAFCLKLSQLPHLYSNKETDMFLRQQDQKFYQQVNLKQPPIDELLNRYQNTFPQIVDFTVDAGLIKSIDEFAEQIKSYSQKLKGIKKFVKDSVQSSKEFYKCLADIIKVKLINYENHYVKSFVRGDNTLFFNERQSELQETYKQEEQLCYLQQDQNLRIVMLRMINDKVELQNRVKTLESKVMDLQRGLDNTNNGKKSLVNMIKQKSAENIKQELNDQINSIIKEIQQTNSLIIFIQKIIGLIEIQKYYNDKNQQFKDIMTALQQMELESINIEQQYWTYILNETNNLIAKQEKQQFKQEYQGFVQEEDELQEEQD